MVKIRLVEAKNYNWNRGSLIIQTWWGGVSGGGVDGCGGVGSGSVGGGGVDGCGMGDYEFFRLALELNLQIWLRLE